MSVTPFHYSNFLCAKRKSKFYIYLKKFFSILFANRISGRSLEACNLQVLNNFCFTFWNFSSSFFCFTKLFCFFPFYSFMEISFFSFLILFGIFISFFSISFLNFLFNSLLFLSWIFLLNLFRYIFGNFNHLFFLHFGVFISFLFFDF